MPFPTPDFNAIRDGILRDIANQAPEASVGGDSDFYLRANATGAAIEGLYQHQQWLLRQLFVDSADADTVDRIASLYNLTRLAAVAATGTINFSGVAGSAIPAGTEAKTLTGIAYVTTAAGIVGGGGTAVVAAQAAAVGSAGNQAAATPLTLTAAPTGVNGAATIAGMSGGADIESTAALLARLLFRFRNPPHGGAAHDYYGWATAVGGVANAYVYPNRRGNGTTDVIVTASGGLPSGALVAQVQAAIDSVRPVQADVLVLAPTAVNVAVTASLTLAAGTTLATATAAITAALTAYFATLKPGDSVIRNAIRALIQDTAGVIDHTLTAPAANVATTVDATHSEMPFLGAITPDMTHADLLKLLLPPSSYDAAGRVISAEMTAEGNALDGAQYLAEQILVEADPRTAVLTLADWERVYGLPDPCVVAAGIAQSLAERRSALVTRITLPGGQSPAYYIALAASLGYAVTITEGHVHTTEHDTEDPTTDETSRFIWYVNAPLDTVRELTTEDDTEMATAVWGNALLECVLSRFKPAHTQVIFLYS